MPSVELFRPIRDPGTAAELSRVEPLLQIRDVSKKFGSLEVLRSINVDVSPGELVFLIGPSGSGKSTLLRCCNRLEEATSGSIRFDGAEVLDRTLDVNALRRRIGMVFQSFNLYPHMTALSNVTLALRKVLGKSRLESKAIAMAALERVGLAHKADAYPAELSGGQQQRVAIARGLALEPKMMLFDEPTSALDPELVGSVLATMRSMREAGMTMLVVSHEMRFAREAADRVVFMEGGVVVEQGPPAQIFGPDAQPRTRAFVSNEDR
ncbi:amino acid ABC transporter ATP-binding protein [Methylobacterium currus]|uniref:Amino acid ABC transporter ATP-binding protein n=1 Tax=Methylobacterium currus TaxID=2051553 RepID=A0A2R4WMH2_9HYPH|nr:amino acid ABC transporter ATP-binding protein [Methylobacterium currus]AWB22734.1 amino acid ABC transporter ATP-binding protein [Methylobacterium currus]UHC17670.1 amino acid ABC transporter ATP-binding protein [Methylobacterium currus]